MRPTSIGRFRPYIAGQSVPALGLLKCGNAVRVSFGIEALDRGRLMGLDLHREVNVVKAVGRDPRVSACLRDMYDYDSQNW